MTWIIIMGSLTLFYFMGRWNRESEIIDACYKQEVDDLRRHFDEQCRRNEVNEMIKRFNSLK